MKDKIIRAQDAVTLVGGGAMGSDDFELALDRAPIVVAADAGAGAALQHGHVPLAVIGDFDSLTPADLARLPSERLFQIAEQDTTDFEKALSRVVAPFIIAVGFLGGRIDHQLAAFNALVRLRDRPCILVGQHEVVFHLPYRIQVALERDDRVSLFPLHELSGRSSGLEWPIDGLTLSAAGRVGTSNRALGPIEIEVSGPGLLAMMPRQRIDAVIAALTSQEGAFPA